jgi:hypothetical protein
MGNTLDWIDDMNVLEANETPTLVLKMHSDLTGLDGVAIIGPPIMRYTVCKADANN